MVNVSCNVKTCENNSFGGCNSFDIRIENRDRGSVPYKVINPRCKTYKMLQKKEA